MLAPPDQVQDQDDDDQDRQGSAHRDWDDVVVHLLGYEGKG